MTSKCNYINNMAVDTRLLYTKNWQHKRGTIGDIVTEIYDIKQCIDNIVSIIKGSVPYMPELGCEIIEAIGESPQDAIEIIRAIWLIEIPKQEPRCEVIDITGTYDDNGRVLMTTYFREKSSGKTDYIDKYLQYQKM